MTGFPIQVDFGDNEHFGVSFNNDLSVDFSNMHAAGEYAGMYEFTPSDVAQEIPTANKILIENIIINPIPSNYGLVAYDGSILSIT